MSGARVVALTGATGFLGLHVVKALARSDVQIRILARRDPTHAFWRGIPLDVVAGDLEDRSALEKLTTGADAIVHMAGLIKARSRAEFMRVNLDGARAVAEAAVRHAPDAFFVATSSLAAREPQLSPYAASKRAGEDAIRNIYSSKPDQLAIVRPPAIYGPWDRETLTIFKAASHAIAPVFGNGRIAIIHVDDAAAAIGSLAIGAKDSGDYALADINPAGYSTAELLREAAHSLGKNPRLVRVPSSALAMAGLVSQAWGSVLRQAPIFTSGKAREMLHPDWSVSPGELLPAAIYQSKIGIREGFASTAAWYKAAGWLR
jgi:nucleoside-diphosphate-sugar epimerase